MRFLQFCVDLDHDVDRLDIRMLTLRYFPRHAAEVRITRAALQSSEE